ncbi:MAG TPA: hypothetical protein VLF20_06335 [Patescibacteria group bacterium]|nr:hypothetical protein [Patescibacteria group bacterium]
MADGPAQTPEVGGTPPERGRSDPHSVDPRPAGRRGQQGPRSRYTFMTEEAVVSQEEVMKLLDQVEEAVAGDTSLSLHKSWRQVEQEAVEEAPDKSAERAFDEAIIRFGVRAQQAGGSLLKWKPEWLRETYETWSKPKHELTPKQEEMRRDILELIKITVNERERIAAQQRAEGDPTAPRAGELYGQVILGEPITPQPVQVIEPDVDRMRREAEEARARTTEEAAKYEELTRTEREEAERLSTIDPKPVEEPEIVVEREPGERNGKTMQEQLAEENRAWRASHDTEERKKEIERYKAERKRQIESGRLNHLAAEGAAYMADVDPADPQFAEIQAKRLHEMARLESGRAVPGTFGETMPVVESERRLGQGEIDYFVKKDELLDMLKENRNGWEKYGWSADEVRIARELLKFNDLQPDQAENFLAAIVLHGYSAEDVQQYLVKKSDDSGNAVMYLLERTNLAKNDEDVLDMFYPTTEAKADYIYRMTSNQPTSFEDLAFQMMSDARTHTVFKRGRGHELSLIKNVVFEETDGQGNKRFNFEERVNIDSMFKWFNYSAMEAHGNHTTSPIDFEQQVEVKKSGYSVPLTVYEMMLGRKGKMFEGKYDKKNFGWVADYFELQANVLSESRNSGIQMQQVMGDKKQLEEYRMKELVNNNFARNVGGTSMMESYLKFSEIGGRREIGDRKVGALINMIYLSYSNLADAEKLAQTMGFERGIDDPQFKEMFSLKHLREVRNGMVKSRRETSDRKDVRDEPEVWLDLGDGPLGRDAEINGIKIRDLFADNEQGTLRLGDQPPRGKDETQEAYDKRMAPYREKFMKFFNFFTHVTPSERFQDLIKGVIIDRASSFIGIRGKQNGLGIPNTGDYADMVAEGLTYRLGIYSVLDIGMSGRTEEAKPNARYLQDRGRKDAHAGNIYQLGFMPQNLMTPEALVVSVKRIDPRTGKPMNIQNALEAAHEERLRMERYLNGQIEAWREQKTVAGVEGYVSYKEALEAKKEALRKGVHKEKRGETSREREAREDDIKKDAKKEVEWDYRDWLFQHDQQIIGEETADGKRLGGYLHEYDQAAAGLAFDKHVERNYLQDFWQKGWTMDQFYTGGKRLNFADYVHMDSYGGATIDMDKWVADSAKFFNTMRKFLTGTKFSLATPIRQWNDEICQYETVALGEAVLGKQVLNHLLKNPEYWQVKYDEHGDRYTEVNWDALDALNKKGELAKWMEMGFITGQMLLYTERAEWNLNPRYNYQIKAAIVQALKHLPGDIFFLDPNDARGTDAKNYFPEEMLDWFREASGTKHMFWTEALANLFSGAPGKKAGLLSGLGAMFSQIGKAISIH